MQEMTCYECRKPGHLRRNCPLLNGQRFRHGNRGNNSQHNRPNQARPTPPTNQQGKAFATVETKGDADNAVVEVTLLLFNSWVKVLFDPGATHSFISDRVVLSLDLRSEPLEKVFHVITPVASVSLGRICRACIVRLYRPNQARPTPPTNQQGKAFATVETKGDADNAVVEGTLLLFNSWVKVLFDPGATHSFISDRVVLSLDLRSEPLEKVFHVITPVASVSLGRICRACIVRVGYQELSGDLIVLGMTLFDVILGMDWLAKYQTLVDFYRKKDHFSFQGWCILLF
ncbi:uncharacterized protein LOC113276551 [Papaver somniferum]|uniref:uncharacterized protein LOC113276551 n=1 Tax=Papaver somniferum TaxID=3469 RepID=UPI000E7017AE|nr:uncharacterized protein LOC113276551 [Papaver somniferum]XP_026381966.1 uncharacterized protein LOC113276551 [Papaver somniferum]